MNEGLARLSKLALSRCEMTTVPIVRLLEAAGHTHSVRFTADDYQKLCELGEECALGIEPDPRYTGFVPRRGESVVIFRLSGTSKGRLSEDFLSAAAVLGLASAVATADDEVADQEKSVLESHLGRTLSLEIDERSRLRAWLRWLVISSPRVHSAMLAAKERLLYLPTDERSQIAEFTVSVAAADGIVNPSEIDILAKIYRGLSLPDSDLFDRLEGLEGIHVVSEPSKVQADEDADRDNTRSPSDASSQADAVLSILFGT